MKSKGQDTPIMPDSEFAKFMERLRKQVEKWLSEGQDYDLIRIQLIGTVLGIYAYNFTRDQLSEIFNLGFTPDEEEEKERAHG